MSQIKLISRASRVLSGAEVRSKLTKIVSVQPGSHANVRTMATSEISHKSLTLDCMNQNIVKLQYAVRGPLVVRAAEIEKELEKGAKKPFKKVIKANIGDAHAMGQVPITFIRQVLACLMEPELIEKANYPADVKKRAQDILSSCGGVSMGSYTMSHGIEMIRRHVAEYIERRDGHKANWQDICLVGGASNGIKSCLQLLVNKVGGKDTGVMIPIPQYPLYSASLAEYGLGQVGYYLDEDNNWALDEAELERSFAEGSKTHAVRALVVINPGNPTGQVLTRKNIETIVKFAQKYSLFLFADEVYQHNIYAEESKFYSLKKGAMYAFPNIDLPPKAIEAAEHAKQSPDTFYAFKLLEATGICIVPGSVFSQRPGSFHFRTTILPQPDALRDMLDIFQDFHQKFTKEYS